MFHRKTLLSPALMLAIPGWLASAGFGALNSLATTPPMGWNSYDSYGALITGTQLNQNATYMAAHLKSLGYTYITLDYCWSFPYKPGPTGQTGTSAVLNQTYDPVTNTYTPTLSMDAYGRLLPDAGRFPSSLNSSKVEVGLKPLIDAIHKLGLKFGLHILRGIPRQAVTADTPIFGTSYTAQQAADTSSINSWNNQMYGVNNSPAGQAYYNSIFKQYASWGVDLIKIDDITRPFYTTEMSEIDKAVKNSGRSMVISLSPGAVATSYGSTLQADANMWRFLPDTWDIWSEVNQVFSAASQWTAFQKPGSWPDADALPIGKLVSLPNGPPRNSWLTHNEQRTVVTLWSIIKSPLFIGGDLPSLANDSWTTSLLTDKSVLAVDQTSLNNHQVFDNGTKTIWEADVADSADKYLALFNRGKTTASESVAFTDLGLADGSYDIHDLWSGADLGVFTDTFSASLASHASGLYEISALLPPPLAVNAVNQVNATNGGVSIPEPGTLGSLAAAGFMLVGRRRR